MMQQYNEFINKIKKVHGRRNHEIKNSYGVRDAFRFYRKIKPEGHKFVLKDTEYYSIIRTVNNIYCDILRNSDIVILPCKMGKLITYKYEPCLVYNGKLKLNKRPIDWNKTLKLWYEDKECKDNKQLVYCTDKEAVKLQYDKHTAEYKNKSFFVLEFNRGLKASFRKLLNEGKFDTIYNGNRKWHNNISV